jgi:predicted unusual protein kinase regulating ubiquinone biosynthesis (AarF/ABC1/UbiB family)
MIRHLLYKEEVQLNPRFRATFHPSPEVEIPEICKQLIGYQRVLTVMHHVFMALLASWLPL